MITAIFDLQVAVILPTNPTKFPVNRPSVQVTKHKTDFQYGGHLGFRIGTILATIDLQVAPILPIKFPTSCSPS